MAIRPILIAPDPKLKAVCSAVARVDDEVRRLVDDMLETMYAFHGVGLAAPQLGVARRLIVVDCARAEEKPNPIALINPNVVWESEDELCLPEGCLSFPDQFADVARPAAVGVRFLGRDGRVQEIEAKDVLATCIQHEIDHLDGVLFVDHLSALKRRIILRKLAKMKRSREPVAV